MFNKTIYETYAVTTHHKNINDPNLGCDPRLYRILYDQNVLIVFQYLFVR